MSPLLSVLVTILKKGAWVAGAIIALFIAIVVLQARGPDGAINMKPDDWKFIALLIGMLLLAVYLVYGFTKELGRKDEGSE